MRLSNVALILLVLLVLACCAGDDYEKDCPSPSDTDGLYAFCVTGYLAQGNIPKDEGGIDHDASTPIGYYDAGTEITVATFGNYGEITFIGWYDASEDDGWGELVSEERTYTFNLLEDTYLWIRYSIGGY
jgi:hypothetical protein